MVLEHYLSTKSKGITPIIATVLLLGITVAIGLTVYTQAQGMIGNTDTDNIEKVQNTDIDLTTVYKEDGQMRLQVSNKGDRAINVTDYTIYYGPPNFDPVSYSSLDASADDWTVDSNGNKCFNQKMVGNSSMSNSILSKGKRASCTTGIEFPDSLQTVEIEVRANGFEFEESYLCSVESGSLESC